MIKFLGVSPFFGGVFLGGWSHAFNDWTFNHVDAAPATTSLSHECSSMCLGWDVLL